MVKKSCFKTSNLLVLEPLNLTTAVLSIAHIICLAMEDRS